MACKGLQLALSGSAASTRNKVLVLAGKLLKRLCMGTHASLQVLQQLHRKRKIDGAGQAEVSREEHAVVNGQPQYFYMYDSACSCIHFAVVLAWRW